MRRRTLLLVALSPLLLAIALAMRLSLARAGPLPLARARAWAATPFDCLKFRTMRDGADQPRTTSRSSTRPTARCSRSATIRG